MKAIHVPRIDARYWAGITMASVFGTNTGDWFAFRSGLGVLGGLPILAAIIGVACVLERRDNTKHEVWYWLAIILIRTGATNIADYVCGRRFLGVNRVAFSLALAVFIAAMAVLQRKPNAKPGLPQTDANYWTTMLAAGVFGTAAGDAVLGSLGGPEAMGGVYASAILTTILAVLLLFGRGGRVQLLYYYWLTICVARTAGTAIADMLAENESLNIGLVNSTIISGIVFVAVLVLWRSRSQPVPATS
jgi:uncharacterized membrane-anchored protein